MSVKLVKQGLRAWIEANCRIDIWDLDLPANVPTVLTVGNPPTKQRFPANCAVEFPVQNLSIQRSGNQIEGEGRFIYAILYRFSGKAAKEQLPIKAVENLNNYLLQEAIAYPNDIWEGIRSLEAQGIDEPVSLARVEGEDSDWLIISRLEFQVRFLSKAALEDALQPPPAPPPPDVPIQLAIAVYRALHPVRPEEPETYTEDTRLELP